MDQRPVAVFDSGLGGLTAVRVLRQIMPNENIIYFGDTGRMPYGGRPREQIRKIARQNIAFVESFGVKAILAACGTISSNAQDILAENKTLSVGVLTPGAEELAATGKKRLGVIATKTSIESGAFQREILARSPDAELIALPCPKFVPMIESGHFNAHDPLVREIVAETLAPLKDAGTEALLLGCTHYGIIADAIRDCLGADVVLVGAADASAMALKKYIDANELCSDGNGEEHYYTSGSTEDFMKLAPIMLGYPLLGNVNYTAPFPLEEKY